MSQEDGSICLSEEKIRSLFTDSSTLNFVISMLDSSFTQTSFNLLVLTNSEKQRHYFANEGPSSQGYGFSSSHVWMWELDCEESWVPQNWCFWTVVLEKTLESPLDCKEIQPVHSEGDQYWVFFGRNDAEDDTLILWSPDANNWLLWKEPDAVKDWRWAEKRMTVDEMVG